MIRFWQLPLAGKIALAIFSAVSSTFAICVSINTCRKHRKHGYTLFSFLSAALSTVLFLGISDVFLSIDAYVLPSALASFVGGLPYGLVILLIGICDVCAAVVMYASQTARNEKITPWAIKEAFDILPDGICFATEEGLRCLSTCR